MSTVITLRCVVLAGMVGAVAGAAPACAGDAEKGAALASPCVLNTDCAVPLVCVFERCHLACATSHDCPTGARCVVGERPASVCQLDDERDCTLNSQCPAGQICAVDGHCRDECATERDCPPGQLCVGGTCAEPSESFDGSVMTSRGRECTLASDCPDTLVCIRGRCHVECRADRDCRIGSSCVETRCAPGRRDAGALLDAAPDADAGITDWCTGGLQPGAAWPMALYCSRHAGYSGFPGPTGNAVTTYYTGASQKVTPPTIDAAGTVYFGAGTSVYAWSAGAIRWQTTLGGALSYSAPAIGAAGAVYVGCGDANLYALSLSTGSILWKAPTANAVTTSAAVAPSGTIHVIDTKGMVYAFNAAGSRLWSTLVSNTAETTPMVGPDGTVYAGSSDANEYALDGKTGAIKWKHLTGGGISSSPALTTDGAVVFGSSDKKAYALDASTGALRWSTAFAGTVGGDASLGPNGSVYFIVGDNTYHALNASTGADAWSQSYTGALALHWASTAGSNGIVYMPYSGVLHAYDVTSHKELWTVNGPDGYPALDKVGRLYAGSTNGNLYIIGP